MTHPTVRPEPQKPSKDEQLPKDQAEGSTQPSGAEDPGSEVEFMRDSDHMKDKK